MRLTLIVALLALVVLAFTGCPKPKQPDTAVATPIEGETQQLPGGDSETPAADETSPAETDATSEEATTEQAAPQADESAAEEPATEGEPAEASGGDVVTTDSGLKYEDLTVGTGAEATDGATVTVHYVGTLANGKKFDSSRDRGEPFTFHLGAGEVIPGWEEGVKGMKVGGKRKLTVPPDLAYGEQGVPGDIPPNSTLTFEVELLKVG